MPFSYIRMFSKFGFQRLPVVYGTIDLRPRGVPRSVRAGARMRVTEVRKAGSSDPRRPKASAIRMLPGVQPIFYVTRYFLDNIILVSLSRVVAIFILLFRIFRCIL